MLDIETDTANVKSDHLRRYRRPSSARGLELLPAAPTPQRIPDQGRRRAASNLAAQGLKDEGQFTHLDDRRRHREGHALRPPADSRPGTKLHAFSGRRRFRWGIFRAIKLGGGSDPLSTGPPVSDLDTAAGPAKRGARYGRLCAGRAECDADSHSIAATGAAIKFAAASR
jgi:hypothetical protein